MLMISFFSELLSLLKDIFGFPTNLQSFILGWGGAKMDFSDGMTTGCQADS